MKEHQTLDPDNQKNCVSLRIKILIKNMFDNKDSGWKKTKEESKIQKKDEVEKQVKLKDQEQRSKTFGAPIVQKEQPK
jgi:D-serine dehydratase